MPTLKEMVAKYKIEPNANGNTKVVTEEFRCSYAFVWEPWADKEEPEKSKYSIQLIFKKNDEKALKVLIQAAANAAAKKFGSLANWPKFNHNTFKLAVEENESTEAYYKDTVVFNARSKNKPGIVGPDAAPLLDQNDFYSGCIARASITAFGYDAAKNKGVSFGLNNLMKVRDDDRLDGGASAEDDFGDYAKPADEDGF